MPVKRVDGVVRRRHGVLYWEYTCPYCHLSKMRRIGDYTKDPKDYRFIVTTCGHNIELVQVKPKRKKREGGK
jgi:transposase-like protein